MISIGDAFLQVVERFPNHDVNTVKEYPDYYKFVVFDRDNDGELPSAINVYKLSGILTRALGDEL